MTSLLVRTEPELVVDLRDVAATPADQLVQEEAQAVPVTRARTLIAVWLVAVVVGMAFVVYGFGPFFQQREQRGLMRSLRADLSRAANEATGLEGVTVPTKPLRDGTPLGVLEVGAVKLQQVVVEGSTATRTRSGPGHVPGTAGLGQPGNAVVVGRRTAFGGPFADLRQLRRGDSVLATTTQGQSVYEVRSVERVSLAGASLDRVYGPSDDDRLTLVTSAGSLPWNDKVAWVVTARLQGTPFAPTPQGGRSDAAQGRSGDPGATSSIVLAVLGYGLLLGASVVLYRRLQPRTAYLLTIAPILAMTIIAAETLSRAFPAWM